VTLLTCWLLFPAVLTALSLGCGLLVETATARRLPFELLLPTGFAAIVGISLFTTLSSKTARLTLPLVLAVAVVGLATALPPSLRRVDRWAAVAGLGVFAVYAAPIVLSGDATFAGYVKLDDTATFLAMTDRALEHGRSLEGLAPSSYEAALAYNLPFYPLGSLLPLGIGGALVGEDIAWVFQPYLAFLAALLGLALYRLAGVLVESRTARAAAAFLAAQAALLYGYSLWGGIKEVAAAALVALVAALTSDALDADRPLRTLLPLGIACAAVVGVLSVGAAPWLLPALAVVGFTQLKRRRDLRPAVLLGAGVALLVPSLAVARLVFGEGVLSSVRDDAELGNLIAPLSPLQIVGVWPVGDFRFEPDRMGLTYVLVGVTVAAAVTGLVAAVMRRAWELPLYVGGVVGAALVYALLGSPWIEAKAFAIAAPAVVLAAVVRALTLFATRRIEGAVVLGAIVLGLAWSNLLAFGETTLAPRDQLAELESIGEQFSGQGPALMTEYQPYGVRHFLRRLDAEGASELRRRTVPLRNGSTVPKAGFADISAFRAEAVLPYRTLVLRRTPVGTRPPAPYRLIWQKRFYEVWQRPLSIPVSAAEPRACAKPLAMGGSSVTVPHAGRYELWVGGSVRGELTALVDGRPVGRVQHILNHRGHYTSVARLELSAGRHSIATEYRRSRRRPGQSGEEWVYGPLLVTPADRCV
jgi:Ca2+/Na+ antiporter